MVHIRATVIGWCFAYGLSTLVMIYGQSVPSVPERVSLQGQQIGDAVRRIEDIERLDISARLARIETQIEISTKASERSSSMSAGALLCLLGLLLEMFFRVIAGMRKKEG